jgi:hypothetical protein
MISAAALRDPHIVTAEAPEARPREADPAAPGRPAPAPAVLAYLARQLAAVLDPAFQALKPRTRYGLRGMWGQVADQIAGTATRRGRQLRLDPAATWQIAHGLTDALAVAQPMVRMRPMPFASQWPEGPATVAVKGTCCLYFKACEQDDAERHCCTCPLLPDAGRASRVTQLLRREYERLLAAEEAVS